MLPADSHAILTDDLVFDSSMLVSAIILAVTFIAIFTEGIHKIHRTKVALFGGGVMVVVGQIMGFYNPSLALEAIDWNVVLLLGGMMAVVAIMIPTGGFQAIAYWIARFSKGRSFLLMVMMGTAITIISTLLDNVTTVVIFGPLIVLICQVLGISPIPHLMAAAILANTGGVATLVGDPPNVMIGSAANISFSDFFEHMGGIVLCAWLAVLGTLYFLFKKHWVKKPSKVEFSDTIQIEDKRTWYLSLGVLGMMVVMFLFHNVLHWDAWVVAAFGMTILLMASKKENPDFYLEKVELSLLMFFVGLFIIVGGVEHSQFLIFVGQFIEPFVEKDLLLACILLMWSAAVLSAMIDNIPFTAAMIPIILGMETQGINVAPLWWALAIGAGMGGNCTHLGSSANMFIITLSEKMAKREGKPHLAITPGLWLKRGLPAMLVTLSITTVIMWAFFDFYSRPIEKATRQALANQGVSAIVETHVPDQGVH